MTRPPHAAGFHAGLRELYDAAAHNRPDEVFRHLRRLVPEYSPAPGSCPRDRRTRTTSDRHLTDDDCEHSMTTEARPPLDVRVLDGTVTVPPTVFDDSTLLPADRATITALGHRVEGADLAAPPVVLPDFHHKSKMETAVERRGRDQRHDPARR